jgi:KRAB domain-containing zinc finger protein
VFTQDAFIDSAQLIASRYSTNVFFVLPYFSSNRNSFNSINCDCQGFKFACPECKKEYPRLDELGRHLVNNEFATTKICFKCGFRAPAQGDLTHHLTVVHSYCDVRACDECGEAFPSQTRLDYHKFMRHRFMMCPVCDEKLGGAKEPDVVAHLRDVHDGAHLYPCDVCEQSFVTTASRYVHHCSSFLHFR